MTTGVSKERLLELWKNSVDKGHLNYTEVLGWLLGEECKELDPWLPIDESTPKDRELILITEECGKVVGKWFEPPSNNGWWTANCRPVTPTHYKELPKDPEE